MTDRLGPSKRFSSRYDDLALLDAVRVIAVEACPEAPHAVSQRRYDAARASAGHPHAPTAAATARRFETSWSQVLDTACDPTRNGQRSLSALRRLDPEEISFEDAVLALRIAAHRAGSRSLNPAAYQREHQALLDTARRRRRLAEDTSGLLPALNQIEQWGPLEQMLRAAGVTYEVEPAVGLGAGVPIEKVMEKFLMEQGFITPINQLRQWARIRGMRVRNVRGRLWADRLADLAADRAGRGHWTPTQTTSLRHRKPDLAPKPGHTTPPTQRTWTLAEVQQALVTATLELPPGKRVLDQRTYRTLATGRSDMPTASTVSRIAKRHGTTFSALRDDAAKTAKQRSPPP